MKFIDWIKYIRIQKSIKTAGYYIDMEEEERLFKEYYRLRLGTSTFLN